LTVRYSTGGDSRADARCSSSQRCHSDSGSLTPSSSAARRRLWVPCKHDAPVARRLAILRLMTTPRRLAWLATAVLGIPGLVVGVVTGYIFLLGALALLFGLAVGRSTAGIGLALGILIAMAIGVASGLAVAWGSRDWLFYAVWGPSVLAALTVAFKLGTEIGARLWTRRATE
jgi:hypothetical protein